MSLRRIAAFVLLLALCVPLMIHAQGLRSPSYLNSGTPVFLEGSTGTTSLNPTGDSLRTNALRVFGAIQVVYIVKATLGADSNAVVQVSQDSTHWFNATATRNDAVQQDLGSIPPGSSGTGGSNHYVIDDGATGDSLSNGPHTLVVNYGTQAMYGSTVPHFGAGITSALPIPHKFMRLVFYLNTASTITGLSVRAVPQYAPGAQPSDFDGIYRVAF